MQAVVRACSKFRVGLVPQASNISYCTAATPSDSGNELVMSLEPLNQLREIDQANLSLTIEAGVILSEAQSIASDADLMLPLALGSQQSCRIGGNVSTNARGVNVVRYGMVRDIVMGLEVVLPDGSLQRTHPPP